MKHMIFTMGLPGAGKSRVSISRYPKAARIDPDEYKMAHPDYDPKNPGALHEWSLKMARKDFDLAVEAGGQYVVDGTGTNVDRLASKMRHAKLSGFKVTLLFVMAPLAVAIKRNASRERTVPEQVIRQKAATIYQAFEIAAQEADEVITINNV